MPTRNDLVAVSAPLESLEPRRLLSAFQFSDAAQGLGVDPMLLDLPAEGAVSVAALGDLDADGHADILVGYAGSVGSGPVPDIAGVAHVYSGRTGAILRELTDGVPGFGSSVAAIGDVTGDGIPDMAIGSPRAAARGLAYIYSGSNGALVHTLRGPSLIFPGSVALDRFGHALAPIGDVDGDGITDIAVGAPGGGSADQGSVSIFSGATGVHLRSFTGAARGDEFGFALTGAGDVSGDGVPDVLVGAPASAATAEGGGPSLPGAGNVSIYDSVTGDLLRTYAGTQAGARLGHAVVTLAHGAGMTYYLGAPFYDARGPRGVLLEDAGAIATADPEEPIVRIVQEGHAAGIRFGAVLANIGDLDRWGIDNLAVGAPGEQGGRIYYKSRGGALFSQSIPGMLAAGGDVDGDSFTDLVVVARTSATSETRLRVHNNLSVAPPQGPTASSPSLNHVVFGYDGFLISNGTVVRTSSFPGLSDPRFPDAGRGRIVSINDAGHILAEELPSLRPFLIIDGQRIDIPDAVTHVVGAELREGPFFAVQIGNTGDVLLQQQIAAEGYRTVSWLYKDGTLTFLWNGFVSEINASGAILGTRLEPGQEVGVAVLLSPSGELTEIPGLFNAAHLSDDGVVAGLDSQGRVALWQGGVITAITPAPSSGSYAIYDLASGRRLVAAIRGGDDDASRAPLYYDPARGLVELRSLISNPADLPSPNDPDSPVPQRIAASGAILTGEGVLTPIADAAVFRPAPDAAIIAIPGSGALTALSVNTFGDLIAFRSTMGEGGLVRGGRILFDDSPLQVGGRPFAAFVEPRTGRTYVVISHTDRATLYLLSEDGLTATRERDFYDPASRAFGGSPFVGHLITFTSTDGRVHLAGTNAAGDWIVYYQTGRPVEIVGTPIDIILSDTPPTGQWLAANLTRDHLAVQGQTLPALTGITAYVTPWNGMNIAGIDPLTGDIHALWWAPGIDLWQASNLSQAARDAGFEPPVFTGNLASYQTPWQSLHIVGTDSGGRVSVLWWAPGLEKRWQLDSLTAITRAAPIEPGTLTAWSTPWGGMAVAGVATAQRNITDPGEIAVLWWALDTATPDNPTGWKTNSLHDDSAAPPGLVRGRIASTTVGLSQRVLAVAADTGDLIEFYWTPFVAPAPAPVLWQVTNLTLVATL